MSDFLAPRAACNFAAPVEYRRPPSRACLGPQAETSPNLYNVRERNSVNASPGPHATYSAENKYSWNPYYSPATEGGARASRSFPEECNAISPCGPCPIAITPLQGRCMARCGRVSSSPAESPVHSFACETPTMMSGLELSPHFSSVPSEGGPAALIAGIHAIDDNAIVGSTCGSHLDNMPYSFLPYAPIQPVGESCPFNDLGAKENVAFDLVGATGAETPQGQRYFAPLFLPHSQQNASSYPYFMEPGSLQLAPGHSASTRTSLLRFSKMLPPPVRWDAAGVLERDNPQLPLSVLYAPACRWYKHLLSLQGEGFPSWLGSSCGLSVSGKGSYAELEMPCPAPPNEAEQDANNMRMWLKKCNEWWDKYFSDKSRHGDRRRNGGGRPKLRPRGNSYQYHTSY
ncbi:uncharacterized protein Tco025E_07258 [Trypanosoma conorhini]|uniref:Uncharacterized protein n=1 Tax=Trypanosoma conorhini TaxID=83891 RepID=A0A3R7L5D3_9TRYP|nr:uncharacterized protein Tco025E_07258 [Trypanosoma conorhini]RNF07958.1 hypothetical protein Tco025E_07258 [Trypanosoma conorhini]